MKKIILIFNSIIIASCATPKPIGLIERMYVFNFFEQRGFTTAGAYTHFDDLIKLKINKIEINSEDCSKFNQMLSRVTPKNHFQTKFGKDLVFAEALINMHSVRIVISSSNLIVDLTNRCNYHIINENDKQWLIKFINNSQKFSY